MRVSQYFNLQGNQANFDFVDVRVDSDVPLFIDPSLIANLPLVWAEECTFLIQSFFQAVLDKIKSGDATGARQLLSRLGEVNATHLGYSASSEGSGVGKGLAERFFSEITSSEAVKTGLITDIEDTALLIEGIDKDRISDVVTNIIRDKLVEYTQAVCDYYDIPMVDNVSVGPFWDGASARWVRSAVTLPIVDGKPLLLVPKDIVTRALHVDPQEYYRHYVLEYFREEELSARSPLTYTIKSGALRVLKKDVENKYRRLNRGEGGPGVYKRVNLDGTRRNPGLLASFRTFKNNHPPRPLSHGEIGDFGGGGEVDFEALFASLQDTVTGRAEANLFERRTEALLTALFHPDLVHPRRQERIHDGRKILDIAYSNVAQSGFFAWLAQHYSAANVVVECKNYASGVGNPEFDQLAGRFSPSRGQYGMLVFRTCEDKDKLLRTCRDTARDGRGFITPLDESDLRALVDEAVHGSCLRLGGLLHKRFGYLIS